MTKWAERMQEARRTQRIAEEMFATALDMRCDVISQGIGGRCTADAQPKHDHRYAIEDLPEYTR